MTEVFFRLGRFLAQLPMSYIEYVTSEDYGKDTLTELARTNQFTLKDLEQNRSGRISDGQWVRLLSRAMAPVKYSGIALLGWLLACFVVKTLVPDVLAPILSLIGLKSIGLLLGGVTLVTLGAFLLSLLRSAGKMGMLLLDLTKGAAACAEGRVFKCQDEEEGLGMARFHGEKQAKHFYILKDEYFPVDEAAYSVLPEGRQFKLYVAPRSRLMLSIEPK